MAARGGMTPIQRAISIAVGSYAAVVRTLETRAERDTLRDVLCARIAADYLREIGAFDERAA